MARVIAIINEKGGSGKTTTAVSLGAFLAKFGKKVLLCDLDPQANATVSLGLNPKNIPLNIYHSFSKKVPLKDIIKNTSLFNFDIAPASADLAGSNIELLETRDRESVLKELLLPIEKNYDFILLDPPPSLGILTLNALVAGNEVIVPIQCEFFALRSLEDLFEIFDLLETNLKKEFSQIFGLLTMYDKRNVLSREILKKVRETFPGKVFETVIPRSIRLAEAPKYGKTIFQYAPDSKGAKAYERLAEEVINIQISNL
ncbi:MAG TPA: AAA family ATPase [Candidatus Pacearchaeota archaeon]|nr:AAA family ATPase [Candidatus Pacearchaeota archaeon]HOK94201.1 AAA family ATPase [Candidatus Pacearchaeota archaeon]HPO75415.1 AAA family ATPase [Candidatus Pacearchaeota archaeon]